MAVRDEGSPSAVRKVPMPDSSSPAPEVVARLRAAGCVFAEDEAELLVAEARTPDELDSMVERRASGLPLEHVLGWAEFCGRRMVVDAGVFVPRRRTEFLVRQAAELVGEPVRQVPVRRRTWPSGPVTRAADLPVRLTESVVTGHRPGALSGDAEHATSVPGTAAMDLILEAASSVADAVTAGPGETVVVDLCCGSGALGVALAAMLGRVELHAADIDPAAVRCARRNVDGDGDVYEGDLYDALPGDLKGRVDVLLANVPYVPTGDVALLPAEARVHEARVALDGGADGLDVLRRVTAEAAGWLAPGGHLLFETSEEQAPDAEEAVTNGGLAARVARSEDFHATVIIGTKG